MRPMIPRTALAWLVAPALATSSPPRPATIAITHVTVIDVVGEVARADQTVVIVGDRITAVGGAAALQPPRGAQIVDGHGKYVIPGLWDMHTHLAKVGRSALPRLVASGVTGVREMGGSFETVRGWRDSIAAGTLLGPRIEMTGPIVENARWLRLVRRFSEQRGDTAGIRAMDERIPVATPEDAVRAVERVAALRVSMLKVRTTPPRPAFFALLREARRRGLRVVGHPPSGDVTLAEASDSGQVSFEHQLLEPQGNVWVSVLDAVSPDARTALVRRLITNHTAMTPTIVAGVGFRRIPDSTALALIDDSLGLRDPRRRCISREVAADWRRAIEGKALEGAQPDWEALARQAVAHLRALDSAGVLLLAGTDLGSPLVYPGFSIHEELERLLREGGMSSARALRTATLNPARFFGVEREVGTVSAGKRADLVLLNGDPLSDIANVSRIDRVVLGGRLIDPRALAPCAPPPGLGHD